MTPGSLIIPAACQESGSLVGPRPKLLYCAATLLGVEAGCPCGPGHAGRPPNLGRHQSAFDDDRQFRKAVGDVAGLFAVPLAGDHEKAVAGQSRPLAIPESQSDVFRQVRATGHVEPEHGLGTRAVDVLAAGAGGPGKLPCESLRRNHDPPGAGADHKWSLRGHAGRPSSFFDSGGAPARGAAKVSVLRPRRPSVREAFADTPAARVSSCPRLGYLLATLPGSQVRSRHKYARFWAAQPCRPAGAILPVRGARLV